MTEFPFYVVTDSPAGSDAMERHYDTVAGILTGYYEDEEYSVEIEDCGEDVGSTVTVRFRTAHDAFAFVDHLYNAGHIARVSGSKTKPGQA